MSRMSRRHVVACLDEDDVADHEFPRGNGHLVAAADDLGIGGGHLLESRQGRFSLGLLDHPDHRIEDHDDHDGDGVHDFAQKQRNHRGHDQDDDQKVVELGEKQLQETRAGFLLQLVGPVFFQPLLGFFRGQALFQVGG